MKMKHIKSFFWTTKNAISYTPILFIIYIVVQFSRATLSVVVSVRLGNIISDVQEIMETTKDFSVIINKLIMFGLLNVLLWVLVEIRWRFSDDYLPMRGNVGASKYLFKILDLIPLRKWDNAEFCDKFYRFSDGIYSQPGIFKAYIGIINTIYTFALSIIIISGYNLLFLPIFAVAFSVSLLLLRNNPRYQEESWKKCMPHERKADYLSGMFFGVFNRESRTLGLRERHIANWAKEKDEANEADLQGLRKVTASTAAVAFICGYAGPLVLLAFSVFLIFKGQMLIGTLFTIWELSRSTLGNVMDVSGLIDNCLAQSKKSLEVYETYTLINSFSPDKEKEKPLPRGDCPAISIEGLDFSYDEDNKVLKDLNLTVNKGEIVALLGENGCGKSTLVKLILGVYSPLKGNVRIYGNDADANSEYIRENIGVAFQDFCNYPFTLRENVAFGNISNIDCDDKIGQSLSKAQAGGILETCGNLDRMLGRSLDAEGVELSGGQWQRVAMARAFFADRDIMIFDEPSAKLDPLAEEKQFENVINDARKKGKTVILVSHRVGFARKADKIVYLKDGTVIEYGNHSELMSKKGEYAALFEAQREMYASERGGKVESGI